ncbi:MAG: hypothetical protein HYW70_02355 [Candidatus Nealsonbacteria bacterium]|nr:hypothetical protein [Candidatus Nealsonbacteria bacterium]
MKLADYRKISLSLVKDLPDKTRTVLERRFGFGYAEPETLESIGKIFGLTRERVRQIEAAGLKKTAELAKEKYGNIFQSFRNYLNKNSDVKKEELLVSDFSSPESKNYFLFLLALGEEFQRFNENNRFYAFWGAGSSSANLAKKAVDQAIEKLEKSKKPFSLADFGAIPESYLEITKRIVNFEGKYGLREWPEVNPRFVKDKTYLVLRKAGKPLHFMEVTSLIGTLDAPGSIHKKVNPQTVHNELIKDQRFVLVGRGTYALKEWGYFEGTVKDVVFAVLTEAQQPLPKSEIVKRALAQRQVKANTIALSLQDGKVFVRDSGGNYSLKGKLV